MIVYKFGGGVLKDVTAIRKLPTIINTTNKKLLIIVSAFGKTTGAFEQLLSDYYFGDGFSLEDLNEIKYRHIDLVKELFQQDYYLIVEKIEILFSETEQIFNKGLSENKYLEYDRIVSYGELLSSIIVSEYLNYIGIVSGYANARDFIKTDSGFGDAKVLWSETGKMINEEDLFGDTDIVVTQGFIASDMKGRSTTLGREGSDYSAAIFGYCLDASELVFWKNVQGIFNIDPELSDNARLLSKLSYKEAVEQTFYGAKILHPKTIKPLENKKITLHVKPYSDVNFQGTEISDISQGSKDFYPKIPIFIVKNDQVLISVSSTDFAFIAEDSLSDIFALLSKHKLKVSIMQNSAISFSFCVGNVKERIHLFIEDLKEQYKVRYNTNLSLITIRHYNDDVITEQLMDKEVLLRQVSRYTARYVVKNGSGSAVFRYNFSS